jgi:hypothetical protein
MTKRTKSVQRESIRSQIQAPIRSFFGFDEIDEIEQFRETGEPFLYIDHAYFNRGYEHGNFRLIYNTIHQTKVFDYPDDRRKKFSVKLRDWQEFTDGRIVFIPSPKNPMAFHKDETWNNDAIDILVSKTDRDIYVKEIKTKGLGDSIKKCFALVSHCSVAAVEAACHGVPVVCPEVSPAYHVGVGLNDIEAPQRPDRNKWVNTLTYSQFTLEELRSGYAWDIIKEMNNL